MLINKNQTIGVTLGDPFGIGPEIVAKSLNFLNKKNFSSQFILIGNKFSYLKACEISKINPKMKIIKKFINIGKESMKFSNFATNIGGEVAYKSVVACVNLYKCNHISAMVTAPISKEALHLAKHFYDGHTGLLAHLFEIKNPYLMLANKRFDTIHTTCHEPLKDAIRLVKKNKVFEVIKIGNEHFKVVNNKSPRIGVCGLNPHAGENTILGCEEKEEIIPAIEKAINSGINVEGPISSDIIFRKAVEGKFDLIVAHYHDQGHIPVKLLYFNQSVNVTLGVPFIRTSVDHGTAYDIAYKNKASPINLVTAILYALKMRKFKNF